VQLTPLISKTLFDNLASETSEPGNEPLDEEDPLRNYWRGAAVLSCQSFGLPITPGCLQTYLAAGERTHRATRTGSAGSRRAAPRATATTPTDRPASAGAPSVPGGTTSLPGPPAGPTKAPGSTVSGLLGTLLGGTAAPGSGQGSSGTGSSGQGSGAPGSALGSLLNYLLSR
jgi:hypothetical protein